MSVILVLVQTSHGTINFVMEIRRCAKSKAFLNARLTVKPSFSSTQKYT